jgi:hypothetical protein
MLDTFALGRLLVSPLRRGRRRAVLVELSVIQQRHRSVLAVVQDA